MAELDRQPKFTGGGRMWKWLTIESFIHESQEYKEAWDFQLRHEFREDVNYDWILPYANEENKRCQATLDSVDSKADSLIRYLGAGSAFVSLFLLYAKPEGEHLIWVIAPTLLLLFLSLGCAVIARSPQAHPNPPFTSSAIKHAEFFHQKESVKAQFAAKISAASVGIKAATQYKAVLVGGPSVSL